ncbi:MAG TPA: 16S rRNA (cytosine(1402)-N(4))-methyltransferase [Acidimicrobiaceae bacterium]|nr:16S rRNA (cytosine(1402)-N(4))-methyltransferase [Acidimicrobiaceae bacterium]
MCAEIVDAFRPVAGGLIVDATIGGGGHAEALLRSRPDTTLLGIDRDPAAVAAATARLAHFGPRAEIRHGRFDRLGEILDDVCGRARPLRGALFDFGVSSHQFDVAERGFSFRHEAPLDMRMDPGQDLRADDIVNGCDAAELARILRRNADEPYARRIAARIVERRPIKTTTELAGVVGSAVPAKARRGRRHPATRTFAAIRIEVNDELSLIEPALDAVLERLAPLGRVATLAYHSGEDRIVKIILRKAADGLCECPSTLPCICGAEPTVRLISRSVVKPGAAEIRRNPRASAARLRVAERLDVPAVSA